MSRAAPTAVIFSGFFLLGNLIILWGILLPDMAKDLQMSTSISGLFFSLLSMGAILGAVMGGKYAQRFHFLRLFIILLLSYNIFVVSILYLPLTNVQSFLWKWTPYNYKQILKI